MSTKLGQSREKPSEWNLVPLRNTKARSLARIKQYIVIRLADDRRNTQAADRASARLCPVDRSQKCASDVPRISSSRSLVPIARERDTKVVMANDRVIRYLDDGDSELADTLPPWAGDDFQNRQRLDFCRVQYSGSMVVEAPPVALDRCARVERIELGTRFAGCPINVHADGSERSAFGVCLKLIQNQSLPLAGLQQLRRGCSSEGEVLRVHVLSRHIEIAKDLCRSGRYTRRSHRKLARRRIKGLPYLRLKRLERDIEESFGFSKGVQEHRRRDEQRLSLQPFEKSSMNVDRCNGSRRRLPVFLQCALGEAPHVRQFKLVQSSHLAQKYLVVEHRQDPSVECTPVEVAHNRGIGIPLMMGGGRTCGMHWSFPCIVWELYKRSGRSSNGYPASIVIASESNSTSNSFPVAFGSSHLSSSSCLRTTGIRSCSFLIASFAAVVMIVQVSTPSPLSGSVHTFPKAGERDDTLGLQPNPLFRPVPLGAVRERPIRILAIRRVARSRSANRTDAAGSGHLFGVAIRSVPRSQLLPN